MEVPSCIWSSGGGRLKTSMPYVLLTRPFSFLNSTFLHSSRALSRLGGGLTEVCTAVDGSIIGHAAAAQEDAASGVEQSAGAESQGHDGASSQVGVALLTHTLTTVQVWCLNAKFSFVISFFQVRLVYAH
jgi:hypothetical protein